VTSGDDVARAQRELALQGSDTYSKETLARVGESLGADYVVAGSYVALGTGDETRLRFDVRVQDARSGETITAISESGAESDLLAMVSSAGTKLRGAFGQGSLDTARAAGLAASRPQNPEVVRLYAEGISLLRDFDALGAKSRLEQAATIEPDFALAHGALAEAWSTLGYDARAAEQAQRAFELSKTLGREESLAIEGRLRAIRKEWKKAADVYAVLHGFVPDDLEYGIRLAEARATAGDQAGASEAIRDLRALEAPLSSDPRIDIAEADCARARGDRSAVARLAMAAVEKGKARGATLLVARAQLLLGWAQRVASEYAEAIATLESARSAYAKHGDAGGAALADVQAGIAMFYMGDFEHARARFEPAKVMCTRIGWRSCEASILNSLAAIAWVEGRYADGQKHLEEGRAIALETADKRAELMARANIAQLEIYRGLSSDGFEHAAAVIEELNAGTASDVLPAAQIASAIARLQQGRIGEGRALLLEAVTNARKASNPRSEAEALSKLAVAHFFDGELDKAAEDLESAAALQRRMREKAAEADSLTRLAAVRIAQGRLDEADRILPAARRTLSEQKFLYDWVYASNVTIELALARGKPHEALLTVREIHERAPWIEKPSLRIRLAVTEARILTALGRREEAIGLLEEAGRDADRIDLPLESLGAALALAELQLADPATRKRGVATAQRAKARAAALGLSYFDHKAGQLLAGSSL
jgi:tetratricopeptide (TPR) repeat protein